MPPNWYPLIRRRIPHTSWTHYMTDILTDPADSLPWIWSLKQKPHWWNMGLPVTCPLQSVRTLTSHAWPTLLQDYRKLAIFWGWHHVLHNNHRHWAVVGQQYWELNPGMIQATWVSSADRSLLSESVRRHFVKASMIPVQGSRPQCGWCVGRASGPANHSACGAGPGRRNETSLEPTNEHTHAQQSHKRRRKMPVSYTNKQTNKPHVDERNFTWMDEWWPREVGWPCRHTHSGDGSSKCGAFDSIGFPFDAHFYWFSALSGFVVPCSLPLVGLLLLRNGGGGWMDGWMDVSHPIN